MNEKMLVSVVIPTRNRPQLVCRAIASVLNQTYRDFEIVVVIDGPDSATEAAIANLQEPCIRIVALAEGVGGSEARNTGVRHGRGEWIAFLDDDDEWLPQKLEKQINAIVSCGRDVNFSASRCYFVGGIASKPQPEVFPQAGQNFGEYLYCELTKFGRYRGLLQTSTWLVKREFCLRNPFTKGLKRCQDSDWLLKAYASNEISTCFVPDPCSLYHCEEDRTRVGTVTTDWKFLFTWGSEEYLCLTPKAKAYLYATGCARDARQADDALKVLYFLWKQCDKSVRFTPRLLFLFFWDFLRVFTYRYRFLRTLWSWLRTAYRSRLTTRRLQAPAAPERATPTLDPAHEN